MLFTIRNRSYHHSLLLLFVFARFVLLAQAQEAKDNPDRRNALELYDQGKMADAMPLLERVLANNPKDMVITERLGMATLASAQTLQDPELRKKARIRARKILLQAKELGDNSDLLQILLAGIPEDGSESQISSREDVQKAMQQAEADFVRGDYDKALAGYLQTYLLDPKLYEAALFIGDTYYKQAKAGSAGEWYARAIEINPQRETAYRYWGDALMAMGKMDEARSKFIEAVVAEPYGPRASAGLTQWARKNGVTLHVIKLQQHGTAETKDGKINITIDSSLDKEDDALSGGWLMYSMNRALWQGDKFKKEFPAEAKYRHSLREEAESLHLLVTTISSSDKKGKAPKLDPTLLELIQIDQAGLMEPFVLINRVDGDIAQDYDAYRDGNRAKVYRYLDEFVVPKTPQKAVN